jgi:hypothetical protein
MSWRRRVLGLYVNGGSVVSELTVVVVVMAELVEAAWASGRRSCWGRRARRRAPAEQRPGPFGGAFPDIEQKENVALAFQTFQNISLQCIIFLNNEIGT